jgi:hypothetical protein
MILPSPAKLYAARGWLAGKFLYRQLAAMSINLLADFSGSCFAAPAKKTHIFRQLCVDFRGVRILANFMTALSNSIDCAVNIVQGVVRAMNHTKKACPPDAEGEETDMGPVAAQVMGSH